MLYLFAHRQTCSCEILQNPNCTLPNMHNAVYWPNTDWLTSGPVRKRSDSSLVQTRDVQRKKKKKSKIKNYIMKSRQWLLWTHLIAFNTWFNLSSLYVLTLLFSVFVWQIKNGTRKPTNRLYHIYWYFHIRKQTLSLCVDGRSEAAHRLPTDCDLRPQNE